MATTWMKALHTGKGKSVLAALEERIGYVTDTEKTAGGRFISSYECGSRTAATEFLLSKKQYAYATRRDQGGSGVIAYHIRQSFRPGEVTPAEANAIGYELAMAFTGGQHQFIVATHVNTNSVHSHIIFNSTNLACDKKFVDFKRSAIALRRVSDRICLENGLVVIEKPGLSKGYNRNEYLGEKKAPTVRDKLRALMDAAISGCGDFDNFLAKLAAAGVEVKRGKQFAFRLPDGKRFIRQDTLGDEYSIDTIFGRIGGGSIVTPKSKAIAPVPRATKPTLLIDIQTKLQEGKGEGYRRWAAGFNLKQAAKTLLFLQEHGVDSYDALSEKAVSSAGDFNGRMDKVRDAEERMAEISGCKNTLAPTSARWKSTSFTGIQGGAKISTIRTLPIFFCTRRRRSISIH